MADKLLSLLGLARRAGRLTLGFDAICNSVIKNESKLILTTRDVSEGTARKLRNHLGDSGVTIRELRCGMADINAAIGKPVKLLSVNDSGFARRMLELLDNGYGEE